jgi:hypothetical protein
MDERGCSEENLLFHLFKALIIGWNCEKGRKRFMEELLDEIEQCESHGIVTRDPLCCKSDCCKT